ncbi:type IX secretion system membrane protein PorP/SprF [Arenibacter sp. 6A1]|uniref:PorP/SprF family type IX secretion system membrane protein n=1 Tax=Arenibacter sp. 6A1 TaxID=2720391 RepID=UPI00144503CD|nr:type IX secretion system membrane protein PorP/SprF [Arenibacter sp. 6A1]NKI28406.1 type IX secretion system membrane protein PorP/SprF [Arenibacter sp. 6A1]
MKKALLKICGIICVLLSNLSVNAQQYSQYTQYMYNTISFNPAYAGNRGSLTAMAIYRNQWVGLDGAPETLNFSINTPLGVDRVGLGLGVTSDKIGPSSENTISTDFSYTIQLNSNNVKLSFGLKAGINLFEIDTDKLLIYDPNDHDLVNRNVLSPVVGTGFYLHSNRWYLGFSSPNLLETDHYDDIKVSTAKEKMHVFLTAGYVFDLNSDLKFKPAVLTKVVAGAPIGVDFSANFLLQERVTLGAAYRWDAAVSALAGFQINENIMIGYSYDYDTTELSNYNDGSHEIFLRFELGTRTRYKVNPRFF